MSSKQERILRFLIDAREKVDDIMDLAEHYDLKDELISIISIGVIKDDQPDGDRIYKVDAITSVVIDSEEELASMFYHITQAYIDTDNEDDPSDPDFWINFGNDQIN